MVARWEGIAFASDRSGAPAVYTMRPDGTRLRKLTDEQLNAFRSACSPEGDKIVFSDNGCVVCSESDLFVMNANGTGVTQHFETPENETGAKWSPNGERIAFEQFSLTTSPEGELQFVPGSGEVYVIGEDGEGLRNLTYYPGADDEHPDWAPEDDG